MYHSYNLLGDVQRFTHKNSPCTNKNSHDYVEIVYKLEESSLGIISIKINTAYIGLYFLLKKGTSSLVRWFF